MIRKHAEIIFIFLILSIASASIIDIANGASGHNAYTPVHTDPTSKATVAPTVTATVAPIAVLTAITILPSTPTVVVGNISNFNATDQNGTVITTTVTWNSSNTTVGTITGAGVFTAKAVGTTSITASNGSVNGTTIITVATVPPVLTAITILPSTPTVVVGNISNFNATSQNGTVITTTVTWNSSNTTVGTITGAGMFTAKAAGTTSITASNGSVNGTTIVTVVPTPVLTAITILPSAPTVVVGNISNFNATDQNGTVITTTVTWNSSNTTVGTITGAGMFTAKAAGTTNITASNGSVNGTTIVTVATPALPVPNITSTSPEKTTYTIVKQSANFTIVFDQIVNVTWYLNGTIVKPDNQVESSYYSNDNQSIGTWNVTAVGENDNGTISYSWTWAVEPKTYNAGNRIWDESKGMNTTYVWNSYSFSGFYYDLDSNIGTEQLTINNIQRTIGSHSIVYSTSPIEVNFGYAGFGKYQVIGFMADKYFAGYTGNTTPPSPTTSIGAQSVISSGQLLKVLIDDDTKRTISVGGTLTLQEGYVLKATDIDLSARTMLISLLKDGNEVDTSPLSAGQTYVYSKKVGSVSNLPIIMVRFDSVFSGTEVQAAFLVGLFQISENTTSVNTGGTYGSMEVTSIGSDGIKMDNQNSIGLSAGSTVNLMGNLNIIVANNDTLRFALSVERTGEFEVRGTVYPVVSQWTPMNFGLNIGNTNTGTGSSNIGFYYDLDGDVGTENLSIENVSGNSISAGNIIYSTSPQGVSFAYSGFGQYQVIGFMADKYFAGYTSNTTPPSPTTSIGTQSTIASGQLQKVLIDDEDKRTISVGGTLTLQEGYVLKATDIDLSARTMLISLLKDGNEIDTTPLSAGQTYVYSKKVGSVSNLPIIMVRFDSVFSGAEVQAAFLKGLFQISDSATSVKTGDTHENMEVTSVGSDGITMNNQNSIDLSAGSTLNLMGNINFRVADSSDVRFYPYVLVTPEMVANQLIINAPARATGGDTININVTAKGAPVEGASIDIEPGIGSIGNNTNSNGTLNFTFPLNSQGTYNITATKLGYTEGNSTIKIDKYIPKILNINVPVTADQYETIPIRVASNGTDISNATISYDSITIGQTNGNGSLNYTVESNGSHSISASKIGYITASIDINIRAPYSEFKARDINIIPNSTFIDDNVLIISNITNIGTKADNKSIDLIINGSIVSNKSIYIDKKETKEIDFTYNAILPKGNYTVEILGQKEILEIKEKPYNIILIGAILTILGVIAIYIITSRGEIFEFINKYSKKEEDK